MPKKTVSQMRTEAREKFVKMLIDERITNGDEALLYKRNAFAVPIVLENGDETCVQIVVSIPIGARDGHVFDCYEEAEAYAEDLEEKQKAAKEKEEERARLAQERKAKQQAAKEKREQEEAAKKAKKGGSTK